MKRLALVLVALLAAAPCWAKPIHFFYFVYVTPTFYPGSGATPYYDGPIQISRAYKNYDKCIEGVNEFRWIGIYGAPPSVSVCYEVNVRGVVSAPPAAPTLELPQQ